MKNQPVFFAFLTLLFLLVSYGCPIDPSGGLDPCEEIICYNGGVCVDGECDCPPGYYGPRCENKIEEDPCEGITCYNGGVCVDGECDCPPGFIGPNCETELAPEYMRITGVSLRDWPNNPSAPTWDPITIYPVGSFPDIYFEFLKNGTSVGTTVYDNNSHDPPIEYSVSNYTFPVSAEVTVKIWDYDSDDADDFMAAGKFIPIEWSSGLKEKLVMSNSDFAFDLYVEWVF